MLGPGRGSAALTQEEEWPPQQWGRAAVGKVREEQGPCKKFSLYFEGMGCNLKSQVGE